MANMMVVTCQAARAWLARCLWVGALLVCMSKRTAALWARRVWSIGMASIGWPPAMGQQVIESAVGQPCTTTVPATTASSLPWPPNSRPPPPSATSRNSTRSSTWRSSLNPRLPRLAGRQAWYPPPVRASGRARAKDRPWPHSSCVRRRGSRCRCSRLNHRSASASPPLPCSAQTVSAIIRATFGNQVVESHRTRKRPAN